MKIRKKWISIPMIIEYQRGLFNRDEYLGYFLKNDAAIREDFDF
jgi:hypothetical protein